MEYPLKRIIPDSITSGNLICGAISIYFSAKGHLDFAFFFILGGAFFDFFDGFAARALKVKSDFGIQLDSLADVITFGLAPSFMLLHYTNLEGYHIIFRFSPFIIAAFSALRLAKFNIDKRQTESFIGLPTPANSLATGSISYSVFSGNELFYPILSTPLLTLIYILCFSFFLISEIPLFSLKFKSLKFKGNEIRYFFIFISVPLLIILKINALPIIIGAYIVTGIMRKYLGDVKPE